MSGSDEEYYVIPKFPLYVPSRGSVHNDSGFCYDNSCPCHEDKELIDILNQHVQNGEASQEDANRIYYGKTVW